MLAGCPRLGRHYAELRRHRGSDGGRHRVLRRSCEELRGKGRRLGGLLPMLCNSLDVISWDLIFRKMKHLMSNPCRIRCGFGKDSTQIRRGFDGFDPDSTRIRHGFDTDLTWIRHGFDTNSTRIRHGFDTDLTWIRHGFDTDSTRIR